MASGKHAVKDEIAEGIYNKITAERGGKFLRKVDTDKERRQLGIPRKTEAWLVVDKSVAMNKIKQSLREQQSSTSRVAKASPAYGIKRKASSSTSAETSSLSPRKQRRPLPDSKQQSSSSSLDSSHVRQGTNAVTAVAAAAYMSSVASLPQPEIKSPPDVQVPRSDRQQQSADSDHSSDFEFRRKHPSLRKRDKLRLRREQYQKAMSSSGGGGGGGGGGSSTGGSVTSASSSFREQQLFSSKRQLASESKVDESDDDEEDGKPRAK